MLITAIPISAIAEEKAKVCTDLYDSLLLSGELKVDNGNIVSKQTTEIPLTEKFIFGIDSNEILKSTNLSKRLYVKIWGKAEKTIKIYGCR